MAMLPFFHLQTRDPVLFAVFGIGYLNMLLGACFIAYLARYRRDFIAHTAHESSAAHPSRRVNRERAS